MSVAFESSLDRRGWLAGRWTSAAMLVLGLHVGGGTAGYLYWESGPTEMLAPPMTAIAFELAPVPVAPPPPPKAVEEPDIEPVMDPPPPISELDLMPPAPPEVKVAVAVPEKPKPVKKKKKKEAPEKIKKPPVKPVETPAPAKDFKTASDEPSTTKVESPPQPNTLAAAVPAGPSPDEIARVGVATQQWEIAFYKHIKKYQRYPKSAKRKKETGSPMVRFVFDRDGNVLEAQIVRSSGYESLDEDAIATFKRASPLPPLPPEIVGDQLARNIPINYSLK
ncbi:energy transducer TonB [Dongia rigui]|uniref:TonB family protein n=1 Tax=Dongia rigui TaxID=940149 RepID=A0ABU5E1X1_9PROT|nr:TonB family protein [Dongia rigui]MDY0873546.1 TonB family protein [Dongia rigui]